MAGRQGELPMKDIMPISEVIDRVTEICKVNGVKRLELFGSFAAGTAAPTSDIDFVVYGCREMLHLEETISEIDTLRKIDIFDYDSINNELLNFNLTFDISWKVMRDILIKEMEILGFFAAEKFQDIIKVYYPLFQKLKEDVEKYYGQKESC